MHNRGPGEDRRIRPVFAENRPQRLIVILAAAEERRRSTACSIAPILRSAPLPRPFSIEARASRRCVPRTPEPRIDCEAPFGVAECRLERADLKKTDRHIGTAWHNREADILSGNALAQRSRDESFKAFNACRRRRNESRHFIHRQRLEQCRRIAQSKLAQRGHRSGKSRQSGAPAASRGGRDRSGGDNGVGIIRRFLSRTCPRRLAQQWIGQARQ